MHVLLLNYPDPWLGETQAPMAELFEVEQPHIVLAVEGDLNVLRLVY